ncbi:MAG: nitroreductase family protein [Deltaproteobacteria bacterium]|nr:nitroreductase family protein [Deltaproteobacteria bacterium]
MEKPATADFPLLDAIARRWSPRAFADRPVDAALVRSCLEAARWAPSAMNGQPWVFLVASRQDANLHARAVDALAEGNRRWAAAAPVLIFVCANTAPALGGKPNPYARHDIGIALGLFVVQATALGLGAHPMAGIRPEAVRAGWGLPEHVEPWTAIALGWPGDPASLPDDLRVREEAPRERQPQAAFVFGGRYGEPWKG